MTPRIKLLPAVTALMLFFFSCSDDETTQIKVPDDETTDIPDDEIITIPIVVHVVNYAPDPFTISDEKIKSQIDVLNLDFRKKNADYTKTPDEFIDLVADVGIEFVLATTDPDGKPTTGIIRTESNVTGFDGRDLEGKTPIEDFKLYFTDKGGQDAWPNDHYLNIWIADLSNRHGDFGGLAGYAQFPGGDPRIDGMVMDPRVFGTLPPVTSINALGRTATHEIGHWLNLIHIYGSDGDCEDGDEVDDTPKQLNQNVNTPVHPKESCGSNDMFMNYMDRVPDQSMYMFTKGQKERMRAVFNPGGLRRELYLNNESN